MYGFTKNQNVIIKSKNNKNFYRIIIHQNHSTPGITRNINVKPNTWYVFVVEGYKKLPIKIKPNGTINVNTNMIENNVYLYVHANGPKIDYTNVSLTLVNKMNYVVFNSGDNQSINLGVLVKNPSIKDKFYIKSLKLHCLTSSSYNPHDVLPNLLENKTYHSDDIQYILTPRGKNVVPISISKPIVVTKPVSIDKLVSISKQLPTPTPAPVVINKRTVVTKANVVVVEKPMPAAVPIPVVVNKPLIAPVHAPVTTKLVPITKPLPPIPVQTKPVPSTPVVKKDIIVNVNVNEEINDDDLGEIINVGEQKLQIENENKAVVVSPSKYVLMSKTPIPGKALAEYPKYVLVVTGYNCDKWIAKCAKSIIEQEITNWICVLCDDASQDATWSIIRKLKKHNKKIFAYQNMVNQGACHTRYFGLKSIQQHLHPEDVILLIGGDDYLTDSKSLSVVHKKYNQGAQVTYGNWKSLDGKTREIQNFPQRILDNRDYRRYRWTSTAINTFKNYLFQALTPEDFQEPNKKWIKNCTDLAVMFPILEMADPTRIFCIDKFIYIYNSNYGHNTLKRFGRGNKQYYGRIIRAKPKKDLHPLSK